MIKEVISNLGDLIDDNAPTILLFTGVVLGIGAVIKAFNTKPKVLEALENAEADLDDGEGLEPKERVMIFAKQCWPVVLLTAGSVLCVAFSNRLVTKKALAFATGYKLLEKELEAREIATEKIVGKKKSEEINDAMAADAINDDPVDKHNAILTGNGGTLCYDCVSGRYFYSSSQAIKDAVIRFNELLEEDNYLLLNDFYELLNLPDADCGKMLGFEIERDSIDKGKLRVRYSSQLTKYGVPCLVMKYKARPCYDSSYDVC